MYVPKHFEETRTEALHEWIRQNPFGALVAQTAQGLEASHVPFEIDATAGAMGTLRCHVARANPIWRDFTSGTQAMVLFQGAHGYISPSWYPAKQEHGKVVPTWNYIVVHAYGSLRAIEDKDWLRAFVSRLTDRNEAGRAEPWKLADAPEEYIDKMLRAIVGLELQVERLVGKWKLSQNRSAADQRGVVEGLSRETDALAASLGGMMEPPRMTAGYSGTPLAKKLGIEPADRIFVHGAPRPYGQVVPLLPADVTLARKIAATTDLIHLFTVEQAELSRLLRTALAAMAPDAVIWVSWPKKSSKVPTDITEDAIRAIALPLGLVDIKVCAVDEVWSGLKLVIRKELRGKSR